MPFRLDSLFGCVHTLSIRNLDFKDTLASRFVAKDQAVELEGLGELELAILHDDHVTL